ncbi:MAG: plasmid pRiA4b ORF-3 family protein [Aureispira sp.]
MIYQIKITLDHSKPPIWRRIEVAPERSLEDLHNIIQSTMGWDNSHLHHFMVNKEYYTPPSKWDDFGNDYTGMMIKDLFQKEGQKIQYEYDFGDSWQHVLVLEKINHEEEGVNYPRCIKGKRACPPEDCGGIWGYMNLVDVMKSKKGEQYEEMLEWLGEELEPERFDIDLINKKLQSDNFGTLSIKF